MDDRHSLRQAILAKRRQFTFQQRKQAARQIARQFVNHSLFLKAQHLAFYLPVGGEVNLLPLLAIALRRGKNCYLPALHCLVEGRLHFRRYQAGDNLVANRYGILEPAAHASEIPPWALNVILMPLVAFDWQGNRLGMGKGYYDRTLAQLKNIPGKRPSLIGLAYEWQKVPQLDARAWDVPLDTVITEANNYILHSP
jgi:5-formyltetrahydrofolate cyclo-ligase